MSNDINFLEKGMYFSFARESASITLWVFETLFGGVGNGCEIMMFSH